MTQHEKEMAILKSMRKEIVQRCEGCSKVVTEDDKKYCSVFVTPSYRWPNGEVSIENKCLHADHVINEVKKATKKMNPLKAAKRAKAGK